MMLPHKCKELVSELMQYSVRPTERVVVCPSIYIYSVQDTNLTLMVLQEAYIIVKLD